MKKSSVVPRRGRRRDQLYGLTTLGARGQVVIPAVARKEVGLKPGDHLLVMGKFGRLIGLVKADQVKELVELVMKDLAGSGLERQAGRELSKLLRQSAVARGKHRGGRSNRLAN